MAKVFMGDSHDMQIEKIASIILSDNISLDEQDENKLTKYYKIAKTQFNLQDEEAIQIVNEAFLYLKLKNSDSVDPLQHGDQFGAGFSQIT